MKRRILALLLVLSMVMAWVPSSVFAAETASGTCGDNLTWVLEDGVLTISGTGEMYDYEGNTPWVYIREKITNVVVSNGVSGIGMYAFNECSNLTNISIPTSVTSIRTGAFFDCKSLTSIIIPEGVTSIEHSVFYGCSSLTSIAIPNGVTSIGRGAFCACRSLTSITIPNSVTSLEWMAFSGCDNLTSVEIPGSVTSISESAFQDCPSLTRFIVDLNNQFYSNDESGILYNKDETVLVRVPGAITECTIQTCVTSIWKRAFFRCEKLTNIIMPDGVIGIEDGAFGWCSSLTSVTIPSSVTSIGKYAFRKCTNLTDVYYGGSEAQWNQIEIGVNNECLTNATIHYNCDTSASDDEVVFYEAIYHADNLLGDEVNNLDYFVRYINQYSPAPAILNNGTVDEWAEAWDELTLFYDTLANVDAYAKYKFEQIDVYETILLDALQCSTTDDSPVDKVFSFTNDITSVSKDLLSRTKDIIEIKYDWQLATDTKISELTTKEKADFEKAFETALKESTFKGAVLKLQEGADFIREFMETATTVKDFVDKTLVYIQLWYVSDSMATVLDEMLLKIPETQEFSAMRNAVEFCRDMINETSREQFKKNAIIRAEFMTTGKYMVSKGLSFLWEKITDKAKENNPELSVLLIAYKSGRTVAKYLFGTENITEELCKLRCVNQYCSFLESAILSIKNQYIADKTEENANTLLNSVTLLHAFAIEECDVTSSYADAVEKTVAYKITNAMRDIIVAVLGTNDNEDTKTTLKKYASSLRNNLICNNVDVATHWIYHLEEDFPQYYSDYANLIGDNKYNDVLVVPITRDYIIECPVNVRVYNGTGMLVAELSEDGMCVLGDVSAIQIGERKYVSFYNCEEYHIECDGYADGVMTITIKEHQGAEEICEAIFMDLEVSSDTVYELTTKENPLDNAIHTIECDDELISADFDSGIEKCDVHVYNTPRFKWFADYSCDAYFTCSNSDELQILQCAVTSDVAESVNMESGEVVYTATVEFNGKTYTDTKTVVIATLSNPFTDLANPSTYYDAVLWAVDKGITTGTDKTHFSPKADCTRAQIITFLWRYAGEPEPTTTTHNFVDIVEDSSYYKAVLWAVEEGITTGADSTHFNPKGTCTRAQIVTFLWRYAGKPQPSSQKHSFTDLVKESSYYDAVLWAVEKGITTGADSTHFNPKKTCTRAQGMTFLWRYNNNK